MDTVLVADDEPHIRLLIQASLVSERYVVIEAADGDEAWDLLQRHRPAVAVLDVQMPGKTGLELTEAIFNAPGLEHTRVILLTAMAQLRDVEAGIAAGAWRYLTKPFSPSMLKATVDQAIADA